jgi:hypothetical protein
MRIYLQYDGNGDHVVYHFKAENTKQYVGISPMKENTLKEEKYYCIESISPLKVILSLSRSPTTSPTKHKK